VGRRVVALEVRTDRGDRLRARFVAMGTGPLHRPKLPGISGIETFAGHTFHTSRWDYAYTGGGPDGAPMTGLADKRVGIIGTGATAVQCVAPLGRDAKELYVFQRTPSAIDVRNNHPIDAAWFATLQPGWQQRRVGRGRDRPFAWQGSRRRRYDPRHTTSRAPLRRAAKRRRVSPSSASGASIRSCRP
jgi:cation diffusion facilitator CzcD-associated flavoprotein CzcO